MNRDATINHLILHGYVPSANSFGWLAIWNGETGRIAKHFEDGLDGPGWDVRGPIVSDMALAGHSEVPWHRIDDEALAVLTAPAIPPKYRHDTQKHVREAMAKMDKYGVNSLGPNGEPVYDDLGTHGTTP